MNINARFALTLVFAGISAINTAFPLRAVEIPKPVDKQADMTKPVQVFILLGQSNMVGLGKIAGGEGSLEHAVKLKKKYSYLVDDTDAWTERKDVRFVRMMQGKGLMNNEWMGIKTGTIGPEFGIGHVVGNAVDAPVMILKSCIGNRALGWHLLPPGSARFEEGEKVYAGYRDAPDSWPKGTEPTPPVVKEGTVTLKGDQLAGWYAGKEYDDDTADAKTVLADLDKHYPGAKSYEIAGFFFWQGEKDAGNAVWAAHYEKNLVQFIKQLRKDFHAPNAKFVLATMGESVKGVGGNGGKVLEAHLAVDGNSGKYPEFKGNVATVYSHPMAQGGSGNGHYGGKAEVYMDVGEAMGQAMAELLKAAQIDTPQIHPVGGYIDTHVHAFDCRKDGLDVVDAWMKRVNVTQCVVHPLDHKGSRPSNDAERQEMLANYRKYKGRIHRFCIIYPDEVETVEEAMRILEREKQDGAIGFGEHYGVGLMFDDPKNLLIYDACSRVGLPVMFHIDQKRNMDEQGLPRLEKVLNAYPKCILIAHSYWWRQLGNGTCERLLQKYPNLYADLSPAAVTALSKQGDQGREFIIRNADKLLFGTDAGWWSFNKTPAPEKEWTYFEDLNLPAEVKNKIYRQNAAKLLKLELQSPR
ncbi:Amidohydrolase [Anatilimnocola aggregata]|uniref:Amidohydrolase n=1 Tax=Anatilimnocola aggregata TaxID=2528021 RepID=A0A517YGG3_9BACT|nr:Amidohydrolase [Anatilimnocola aggregata]